MGCVLPNMSLENWAVFVCRLAVLELVWGLENGLCWAGEIDDLHPTSTCS